MSAPSVPAIVGIPAAPQQQQGASSSSSTPRMVMSSSRTKYALVVPSATTNTTTTVALTSSTSVPQSGGAGGDLGTLVVTAGSHKTLSTTPRSGRREKLQQTATAGGAVAVPQTLTHHHLREISKCIDSNKRLAHQHRFDVLSLIPKGQFEKIRPKCDDIVELALAPIHEKESALDVPLRFVAPEGLHAPVMTDPRSNTTIASRIVSLLKGANSLPQHWAGESEGTERDVAKLNAARDAEIRAAAAGRAQQVRNEAHALCCAGAIHYNCGNMEKAAVHFRTAVARFEVVGDARGVAYAHNVLGVILYRKQEYKTALLHHKKQALLSGPYGKAVAQLNLGVCYSALGEHTYAEQAFSDALTNAYECQDGTLETIALGNLGLVTMRQGDIRRSQTFFEQCLEHCSLAGDRVGAAVCLLLLGELYSVVDDTTHALFYYEHAFRVSQEAECADLQEIARVSIGIAKGSASAKEALAAFAVKMRSATSGAEAISSGPTVEDLLLTLP